jgi:hypothetical protein
VSDSMWKIPMLTPKMAICMGKYGNIW